METNLDKLTEILRRIQEFSYQIDYLITSGSAEDFNSRLELCKKLAKNIDQYVDYAKDNILVLYPGHIPNVAISRFNNMQKYKITAENIAELMAYHDKKRYNEEVEKAIDMLD